MKRKVGLIGISGYGKTHLGQLLRLAGLGKIDLAAAVVINPGDVQDELETLKRYGTKIYPSTAAMYAEWSGKLDLVCIPTGIPFHRPMTEEALASGANVVVEKPAAGSVGDVRAMMEAEKNSGGRFVAVGFQHMYAREIQFIKKYLVSGRLGKVLRVAAQGIWPREDAYYRRNSWVGKIRNASGALILDSPANNAFAHYLNLELFLSGETFGSSAHPVDLEAELYRIRPEIETFDTCGIRLRTSSGAQILTLLTHAAANNSHPEIRMECENGSVYWKLEDTWNIRNADGKVLYSGIVEQPHNDMFSDLAERMDDPAVFVCPLSVALEHTTAIEMLHRKAVPVQLEKSFTRRESDGQYILDNVESVFRTCYLENKLPSETGVIWR